VFCSFLALERIAPDWNREAIQGRVNPLGKITESVFSQGEHALVPKAELEARIADGGHAASWPAVLADLDALTETEIAQDGKRFLLRSPTRCLSRVARRCCGAAANRAGTRHRLIAISEHVVPSRRRGTICRVYSITWRRTLSKTGLTS
jgi:hypothetical protein